MPRRRTIAQPQPQPQAAGTPLRLQVYRQLRAAIEQGSLRAGARLPPSRQHAATLGVSRNTVLWAQRGVGDLLPALRWQPPLQAALPFRIGAPEVASFPFALWDRLTRQIGAASRRALAQYLDPAGLSDLREAVAQWLWVSRGVRCDAGQVLVCSGSQQALDLLGRLLLDPGDEVLVGDPGYPGIRAGLAGHGAQVHPVPVDAEGLVIDDGAARWPRARLAVVTPTHQFPSGVRMSLGRRVALLDWARSVRGWVVEDDYDGEFQYGAHRIPALTSLPQAERVLCISLHKRSVRLRHRSSYLAR